MVTSRSRSRRGEGIRANGIGIARNGRARGPQEIARGGVLGYAAVIARHIGVARLRARPFAAQESHQPVAVRKPPIIMGEAVRRRRGKPPQHLRRKGIRRIDQERLLVVVSVHEQRFAVRWKRIFHVVRHRLLEADRGRRQHRAGAGAVRPNVDDGEKILLLAVTVACENQ